MSNEYGLMPEIEKGPDREMCDETFGPGERPCCEVPGSLAVLREFASCPETQESKSAENSKEQIPKQRPERRNYRYSGP
jgi:hypothetical protein